MEPGIYSFTIFQGATFTRTFQWLADDGITPIPLTGYKARMQIRETKGSPNTIVSLTSEVGGGIVIDEALGKITPTISAVKTALLSFTTAEYDLEIESPAGVVDRFLNGGVTFSLEVTR